MNYHPLGLILLFCLTWLIPGALFAEECELVPGDPSRVQPSETPDEDLGYDLSIKGFTAFEAKDFHCAAYYNLKAYEVAPEAVLMQNVANALHRGGQLDAAARYAKVTMSLEPEAEEIKSATKLIVEAEKTIASDSYHQVSLAEYNAKAMDFDWVHYEQGDLPVLPKGTHPVTLYDQNDIATQTSIEVPKPKPLPPPPEETDWMLWSGIGGAGLGLVLVGVATVMYFDFAPDAREYNRLKDCAEVGGCDISTTQAEEEARALYDDIESQDSTIQLLYGVGAGFVVAGSGLLLWSLLDEEEPQSQAIWLAPTPGGASAGLSFTF